MDTARIAALLEPFIEQPPAESQLEQISIYIDLLLRWNARINLTAIRKEEEIVTRHFGESLFMARHLFPPLPKTGHSERSQARTEANGSGESKEPPSSSVSPRTQGILTALSEPKVLDIGSGAGFPGLPLKLWAPNIKLTLVESNHKKVAFLREVVRALTLTSVDVISERAETLADRPDFSRTEVVTLRAVEKFEEILPQALSFLADHSTLALLISALQLPVLETVPGFNWHPPIPIPQSHARVLSIGVRP